MNPVVLDTSVLVAGLFSRRGAAASLVEAIFRDELCVAYTSPILSEYAEVLSRPENPVSYQPPPQNQILAVTGRNRPHISPERLTNVVS